LAILVAVLAAYLGDALVLQVKLRRGTAYDVVQVDQLVTTPLKGQKVEYDFAGRIPVTCVRSIFPQLGAQPCWWVRQHSTQ